MHTNLGYVVHAIHPLEGAGYRYRRTEVAGHVHVDEYVAPVDRWIHLGYITTKNLVGGAHPVGT